MEGYVFLKKLGKGAKGTTWKAFQKGTGRICVIKRMNGSFSKYKNCWNIAEVEGFPHEVFLFPRFTWTNKNWNF